MMSKLRCFFTVHEYSRLKGNDILIRQCDVSNTLVEKQSVLPTSEQEQTVYRGQKEYDSSFIWGQLVGWFKQTVDKPSASLAADRRGTIQLPDLESFIVTGSTVDLSSMNL